MHPAAFLKQQLDLFIVAHFFQLGRIQPARVNLEQSMQHRCQRQSPAIDYDAHVQAEPAILLFAEFRFPCFHFEKMVAETLRDNDLPPRLAHLRNHLLHKKRPSLLVFQPEYRPVADIAGQSETRHFFQPVFIQRLEKTLLRFWVARHAHGLAILQRDEFSRMIERQDSLAVTEFDAREIQLLRAIAVTAKTAHP
jgi:hypothetical protein